MDDFKDMVEYIDMAKKTIRAFSNKICPGICNQMTSSEDAIADIAYAMMSADWKYDENRKGKISNKSKTRYSYRNQCAIWAIHSYIKKYLKNHTVSLNNLMDSSEDMSFIDLIEDKSQQEPVESVIKDEKIELENDLIKEIFSSEILNEEQKHKLKLYYMDGNSLADIGRKYGVTREAIRQNIKVSINKIREVFV